MSTPALEVSGLTKRYGSSVTAVDDLSFAVARGAVTGFLGPNGAGKTTTMRLVLGLATPTRGSTRVLGQPYERLPDPLRSVGAVLEITGFHPGRSGRNHLKVMATQAGVPLERVEAVLAAVGMTEAGARRVGGYSLGMRQRLGLATALLGDPEVLVLDEPANGLDPAGVAWLRVFLRSYADAGRTVFVSSHLLSEIGQIADQVVVIDHGRLLVEGPVGRIVGSVGHAVVVRSPDAARLRDALTAAGASISAVEGDRFTVEGIAVERVGEVAATQGIVLHELRSREASLEDAFLRLTEGEAEAHGDGGSG